MVRFVDKIAKTSCLTLGHYYVVDRSEGNFYYLVGIKYKYPKYYFE